MIAATRDALASTWGGYLSAARVVTLKVICMLTVVAILAALDCLGMPRVAVSLAILLAAAVLADMAAPMLVLAALKAGCRCAPAVNLAVRVLTLTTGAAMALHHLGVAHSMVPAGFVVLYGFLTLAVSVRIGASPAVRRTIGERLASPAALPRADRPLHLPAVLVGSSRP